MMTAAKRVIFMSICCSKMNESISPIVFGSVRTCPGCAVGNLSTAGTGPANRRC